MNLEKMICDTEFWHTVSVLSEAAFVAVTLISFCLYRKKDKKVFIPVALVYVGMSFLMILYGMKLSDYYRYFETLMEDHVHAELKSPRSSYTPELVNSGDIVTLEFSDGQRLYTVKVVYEKNVSDENGNETGSRLVYYVPTSNENVWKKFMVKFE